METTTTPDAEEWEFYELTDELSTHKAIVLKCWVNKKVEYNNIADHCVRIPILSSSLFAKARGIFMTQVIFEMKT